MRRMKMWLVVSFCLFYSLLFSQERPKALSLKEMQNKDGPSYVPIPYPKNNEEIIVDFKYIIKIMLSNSEQNRSLGSNYPTDISDLLNMKPKHKIISNIVKVKNISPRFSEDYYYLIEVSNEMGMVEHRVCMTAAGLAYEGIYSTADIRINKFKSEAEVRELSFQSLGDLKYCDSIERYYFDSRIASICTPMLRIKKNGDVYFLLEKNYKDLLKVVNWIEYNSEQNKKSVIQNSHKEYLSMDLKNKNEADRFLPLYYDDFDEKRIVFLSYVEKAGT